MSKIVRINNGNYDLYVTPNGTITFHDKVFIGDSTTKDGKLTVYGDAHFGNDVTIQNNITVGNDATIQNNLSVGVDANIGHDTTIQNNLSVGVDANIGHDVTIQNNVSIGNDLTAATATVTQIKVDALVGNPDPIEIDRSVRFLTTTAANPLPTTNNIGMILYAKENSDLFWYVDSESKVHSIADTRKALAYSLIF